MVEVTWPRGVPSANIAASSFGSRIPAHVDDWKLAGRKQCLIINKLVNEDVT